jgi:hypothetical protein
MSETVRNELWMPDTAELVKIVLNTCMGKE